MKLKSFKGLEIKADLEKDIIVGYAAAYGNVDSDNDILDYGAFNKSVNDWKMGNPRNRRIKVLWHHDKKEPIGLPTVLENDTYGLYTESKISKTEAGKKVLILARDGVLNEMSVGFSSILDTYDSKFNATRIKEAKLFEYSPVSFGSNEMTTIDDVKELINEYKYSKGNVIEVIAKELVESVKALVNQSEPSKDTHEVKESHNIDEEKTDGDIMAILDELKKYTGG